MLKIDDARVMHKWFGKFNFVFNSNYKQYIYFKSFKAVLSVCKKLETVYIVYKIPYEVLIVKEKRLNSINFTSQLS